MKINTARQQGPAVNTARDGQVGAGRGGTDLGDLPPYVISHHMASPNFGRRVPVRDTEAESFLLPVSDNPSTGVSGLTSTNDKVTPVIEIRPPEPRAQQRSQILQQWEGTVVDIRPDSFGARMISISSPNSPEEWATIQVDEVNDEDRPLIQTGAVFYWSIGYLVESWGQRRTASTVYFRRLPAWRKKEIEEVRKLADAYCDVFDDYTSD